MSWANLQKIVLGGQCLVITVHPPGVEGVEIKLEVYEHLEPAKVVNICLTRSELVTLGALFTKWSSDKILREE
jgi:hypothetical protein